ncbi:MAG: nucleotidyl transferase AbiEii/AbiGii toxin family protein [Lewinellaceae bacterium]|nr:nucleotidyl transferase AbiEii/AbiGii toxin family protein [Lewinellaceae bacterium]
MIPKREILDLATQTNLQPHVVEKDYVLGWLLAGIYQHQVLRDLWVFKGGTCLKKCYFETYRFSEDLDFTLRDSAHIDEKFLLGIFSEIAEWVYENSGIEIPVDRLTFEVFENPRGIESCQGRVYYRAPVTPAGNKSLPRIKLDLTVDEVIVDAPVLTPVRHDYSDQPENGIKIQSYSYVEVFAEKIRALKERARPRDLYDVINFFRRPESKGLATQVRDVLTEKCAYKNVSFPILSELDDHRTDCEAGWKNQLAHQLPVLPPFDSFWEELQNFFTWLENPERVFAPQESIPFGAGEVSHFSIWRRGAGTPQMNMLDLIRFAAVNRLCVELDYRKENGVRQTYLIEPYSLRATADNNLILYGVKLPAAQIRGFRTDRILGVRVTENTFTPRYTVDFIPDVPVLQNIKQSTAQTHTGSSPWVTPTTRRLTSPKKRNGGIQYVFKCPVCNKQFTRSSNNSRLNPHKNKLGQPCYGRTGFFVKTIF